MTGLGGAGRGMAWQGAAWRGRAGRGRAYLGLSGLGWAWLGKAWLGSAGWGLASHGEQGGGVSRAAPHTHAGDDAHDRDDLEYVRTRRSDDVPDGFQPSLGGTGPSTWSCGRYCPVCQHGLPLTDAYCRNCGWKED